MDDYEKYLNSALRLLSFRPRSEKEVRDKLLQKKASQDVIDRVIASLKEHKFLNDAEFARWFVDQRLRFRPKSLRIIKLELVQKGIPRDIIEELGTTKNELGQDNDLDSARKLVEKKIDKYKGLNKEEIYQKLGAYLARRGFDWGRIKKAIDEVLSEGV